MNRATTTALLFDGTEVLVFGRHTTPIEKQIAEYNRLRVLHPRIHADYKELTIQEEHGEPRTISFAPDLKAQAERAEQLKQEQEAKDKAAASNKQKNK